MPFEIIRATFISHKGLNMEKPKPILLKDLGMMYPTSTSKKKRRYGVFKCYCGKEFKTIIFNVKSGHAKSCGCSHKTHNLVKHPLYKVWNDMMRRCYSPNNKSYGTYGAVGIRVAKEWHNVRTFIDDMYPTFKKGLTLDKDRICKEKNIYPHIYSKETCVWATRTEQSRRTRKLYKQNTSGYRGVSKDRNIFSARIGINGKIIYIGGFKCRLAAAYAYDAYVRENDLEHTTNF